MVPPRRQMASRLAILAVLAALLGITAAQLLPYVPTESFDTLVNPPTFEERYKQTTLLSELGASAEGIKFLVTRGSTIIPSLSSFQSTLPPTLTVEPGLSYLALATQAYLAFYGGVLNILYPSFPNSLAGPINTFKHQAKNLTLVNGVPLGNGVSLYSYAAYSLANGPLLITLPPYSGGYWLLPFYDAYGQVYYVVGSRQGNQAGGSWLLVSSDWSGTAPADTEVIRSPTLEGNLLGRTSFNGTGATNWTLTWEISQWNDTKAVAFPPFGLGFGYPETDAGAFQAVNSANPLAFWRVAGEVFRRNGGPSIPKPLVNQLHQLGIFRDYGFIPHGLSSSVTDALVLAPVLANRILVAKYTFLGTNTTNYWNLPVNNGGWGNDYVLAAAIMKGFWISNVLPDAAYYYLYLDGTGAPFNGSNAYELEFPSAPPATGDAFWSIQAINLDTWTRLYGPYPGNPALSSPVVGLYVRPNGTIPVRVQVAPPPANTTATSRGWNWVQGYPGRFNLVLRIYAGDSTVLSNTYVPPRVLKVSPSPASPSPASPSPSPTAT